MERTNEVRAEHGSRHRWPIPQIGSHKTRAVGNGGGPVRMHQARAPRGTLLIALTLVAAACSSASPASQPPTSSAAASPSSGGTSAQPSAGGTSAEPSAASAAWDAVLAAAKGKTVNWYMWGGDETINKLVTGY